MTNWICCLHLQHLRLSRRRKATRLSSEKTETQRTHLMVDMDIPICQHRGRTDPVGRNSLILSATSLVVTSTSSSVSSTSQVRHRILPRHRPQRDRRRRNLHRSPHRWLHLGRHLCPTSVVIRRPFTTSKVITTRMTHSTRNGGWHASPMHCKVRRI